MTALYNTFKFKLLRFHKNARGIVAVEFAFLAPLFLFILAIAIMALRIQLTNISLEQALFNLSMEAKVVDESAGEVRSISLLQSKYLISSNNMLYSFDSVLLTPTYGESLQDLLYAPKPGLGSSADFVCINLKANVAMMDFLLEDRAQYNFSENFCYQNELNVSNL